MISRERPSHEDCPEHSDGTDRASQSAAGRDPLQNSLMELFGLSTILSDEIFGDADTFQMRFTQKNADLEALQPRLPPPVQ